MRTGRPQKAGIIRWNLLDGWPQMTEAVVDYYFNKKLAYGYIKRSQAPFAIIADEVSDRKVKIYACNDTLEAKSGEFTVKDGGSGGVLLTSRFSVKENSAVVIANIPVYCSDYKMPIFEWQTEKERGFNHHLCAYPPISLEKYKEFLKQYIF